MKNCWVVEYKLKGEKDRKLRSGLKLPKPYQSTVRLFLVFICSRCTFLCERRSGGMYVLVGRTESGVIRLNIDIVRTMLNGWTISTSQKNITG